MSGEARCKAEIEAPEPKACTCEKCVSACVRCPGWMLPHEANAAIDAGHAMNLMRDWWNEEDGTQLFLLCPAGAGCNGMDAPEGTLWDWFMGNAFKGPCTFLTSEGRCGIHDSGFKPVACRHALLCGTMEDYKGPTQESIARAWQSPEGSHVMNKWRATVNATKLAR